MLLLKGMAKVVVGKLTAQQRYSLEAYLWKILPTLLSEGNIKNMLQTFLTESEMIMLARRIQVADMLLKGSSIDQICAQLHVGVSTVQGVDRALARQGSDYRTIFPLLYSQRKRHPSKEHPSDPLGLASVRKKYPFHFLLMSAFFKD